jgi:hypothetical protein
VGLFENLQEAYQEKRQMESAAAETNKIIAAKFPKLWQSLSKKVEHDIKEYNHRYPNRQVGFLVDFDSMPAFMMPKTGYEHKYRCGR